MLSPKQGNYWYHFYNVFGMTRSFDWGLNPGPPTLDASTLPQGYRGGGGCAFSCVLWIQLITCSSTFIVLSIIHLFTI